MYMYLISQGSTLQVSFLYKQATIASFAQLTTYTPLSQGYLLVSPVNENIPICLRMCSQFPGVPLAFRAWYSSSLI